MEMDPEQVLAHLARALKRAREARGLSRRRLAELCGLSVDTIKKLEQGHGFHPRLETMVRLASGLEVSLPELFRDLDPEAKDEEPPDASTVTSWVTGLDEPSRALVLALIRVLTRPMGGSEPEPLPQGA